MWRDEVYLARKGSRTTREDRREIIPECIIKVSEINKMLVYNLILYMYRKFARDIQPTMGNIETIYPHLMLVANNIPY